MTESQPPSSFLALLEPYDWDRQTIGRSAADVYRLASPGEPTLFLKREPTGPFSELQGEAERLRWLGDNGVRCPSLLAFGRSGGSDWMLVTGLAGADLASSPHMPADTIVRIAAAALRRLHELNPAGCPFDHRLEHRIPLAKARMEAGLVDEDDFDDERRGWPARRVFDELLARKPVERDVVVTHGDACLPNLISDGRDFSGFVDCGRLGLADRHQDLALACWSIEHNLGGEWVPAFLQAYGPVSVDAAKLAYYRLLDEFF